MFHILKRVVPASALAVCAAVAAACSGPQAVLTPRGSVVTSNPTTTPTTTPTTLATSTPTAAPTATPTPVIVGPTPTATPMPTATPTSVAATITLDPTSVNVNAQGSGCYTTNGFTASEPNYTGNFSAVSNNTSIATVALTSPPNGFTVTSVTTTQATLTTITVKDSHGNAATEQVTIGECLP